MKSNFPQAGSAILLSFCSLLCSAQPLTRADRPDLKVGDSWVQQGSNPRTAEKRPEVTITVREINADTLVTENTLGQRTTWTRDWNVIEVRSGDTVTSSVTPNAGYHQFPLEIGKAWEAKWESTNARQTTRWQGKSEVVAIETVTVPAGTFQAFKIRFEGYYNGFPRLAGESFSGIHKRTTWYSPDAKRAVKIESESRSGGGGWTYYGTDAFELNSFKLGQ